MAASGSKYATASGSTESLGDVRHRRPTNCTYRLWLTDDDGTYAGDNYNDVVTLGAATGVSVTAGSTTADITRRSHLPGRITGKVTSPSGTPIDGMTVTAYEASGGGTTDAGSTSRPTGSATTTPAGFRPGTIRVRFDDNYWGLYRGEFYNDATTFASSTDVAVVAGATTPNINANLGVPC